MKKLELCDGWTLSGGNLKENISAAVPGCVHTALFEAGLIPDPTYRDNNRELGFIEALDWTYSCRFDCPPGEKITLKLEGVDTYADVYLNGDCIGECHNMFIPHAFEVTDRLRRQGNLLEVRFRSPIKEVEGLPKRDGCFTTERMYSRRVQCTYGWDWVERFVTMGLCRPVYLEYRSGVEVEDAYIYTEHIDGFGAGLYCEMEFSGYESGGEIAEAEIIAPNGIKVAGADFYVDKGRYVRRFSIKEPRLWYPVGYGEQPLYTLRVRVGDSSVEKRFGIRTIRIVTLADEAGSEYHELAEKMQKTRHGQVYSHNEEHSGFLPVVNGVPVFCKGGNWVPCEPFISAESDERIEKLVRMAREMGANFLRVWGGGVFERESFYSACDREGILVAQDFLMACGTYPEEDDWFIEELKKEALFAAKYLRCHPSLAWWQGDNENACEGSDIQENYTGRRSALFGLADAIYDNDPSRAFLPSSPFGGNTYASITVGTTHTTNFLGQIFDYFLNSDCVDYKEYLGGFSARFISEEGVFGGISTPSLRKFMTEEDISDPKEEMLVYHTKGNPALPEEIFTYVTTFAKKVLGEPETLDEKLFKYRYIQFEWVRLAFENARRNIGYCNGLLFWMFNECWPAALGWSLIDYYLAPKASYYSFRRLSGPCVCSLTVEGGYKLNLSTDCEAVGEVKYTAYRFALPDLSLIDSVSGAAVVSDRANLKLDLPFEADGESFIVADISYPGGSDRCFYKEGLLELSRACGLTFDREGDRLTVSSDGYIHAVEIETELVPSDNYFSLLPGEKRTVTLGPRGREDAATEAVVVRGYTLKA